MMNFFEKHVRIRLWSVVSAVLAMLNAVLMPAFAQSPEPTVSSPTFTRPALERLVAPIALYPDSLLTHVLMAATYPYEIVQAARWREGNPEVKGQALEDELAGQSWDESVRAVVAFPDVLTMMNEKLDWTQQLGEAFLSQEDDVFAAVQALRARAQTAGNLKSSNELRVTQATRDDGSSYTEIEPVDSEEVYVPVYDPQVVYGAWPYPDDPPYYWYPRGWKHDRVIWFGAAVLVGTALWAAWDWRRRNIRVNPVQFNKFNRTKIANPAWTFKPQHRKGVPFKAQTLTKKFGPIAAPTALQRSHLKQHFKATGPISKTTPSTKTGPITGHTTRGTSNVLKSTPSVVTGNKGVSTGTGTTTTKGTHHTTTSTTKPVTPTVHSTNKTTSSNMARSSHSAVRAHKNTTVTKPFVSKPVAKQVVKPAVKPVVKPVAKAVPHKVEKKP
jgi:hypothetical protein